MLVANDHAPAPAKLTIVDHVLLLLDNAASVATRFGDFVAGALQTRRSQAFVSAWLAAH